MIAARDARNSKYSQLAKQKGIWNGERPDDVATYIEIAIMIERAL
jgi:hypothetical protein